LHWPDATDLRALSTIALSWSRRSLRNQSTTLSARCEADATPLPRFTIRAEGVVFRSARVAITRPSPRSSSIEIVTKPLSVTVRDL